MFGGRGSVLSWGASGWLRRGVAGGVAVFVALAGAPASGKTGSPQLGGRTVDPIERYGQAYTRAWVDTNGYLMFENGGFSDPLPVPIPSVQWSPDAAVYPIWDDWVVDSQASIRTGLHGSAPNRKLVVEWRNVFPFNMWQRIDYQVVFDEATGQITVSYNDIGVTFVERGGAGVVGVENADSTAAVQFSHLMPVLRTGRGLVFTPTG